VLIVMEENLGYSGTLGSCGADPYLCSLASAYASATGWYGVTHPSEPNYVALASGGIQGCVNDSSCTANSLTAADLGGQLTATSIPWVAWMEGMPSACSTTSGSGNYVLKHNPFAFFKDNFSGACHIQPYPGARGAVPILDGGQAPHFVWITPNLLDDMHDGSAQQGDTWLKDSLAPILASSWFTDFPSTVIVTMDEAEGGPSGHLAAQQGGRVPLVVISSNAKGRGRVALAGDHYGTLRSIEESFGLAPLGGAENAANGTLTSLFG
jgi:acid phosphatase